MILRKATISDKETVWEILQQAIAQRKRDGSDQWQHGYPNAETVQDDIENDYAYVLVDQQEILAYAALIFGEEPAYQEIKGKWLSEGDYAVVHRVATSDASKGKGVATHFFKMIEDLCKEKNVPSIKVDTNFDNVPMMKILDKLGYSYCGEIFFIGAFRRAYEKVLSEEI